MSTKRSRFGSLSIGLAIALLGQVAIASSAAASTTTRSTSIALNENSSRLFNVNAESDSVTVFAVAGNGSELSKIDEVAVGRDPVCVAVRGQKAYVTNSASGTVSVIARASGGFKVVKEIAVGDEPRPCALSEQGDRLLVGNHTDGTVSIIDTSTDEVVGSPVVVGGNPGAIAVDGDRVFVTQFYARLRAGGRGEGFDDGKEGVVKAFTLSNPSSVTEITLSPLADSGFTADRSKFCNNTADPDPANQNFCPDVNAQPGDPVITMNPQGVFPNQLGSAVACGGKLYLPNIGAQPEPPLFFNVNVQALVDVVDTATLAERTDLHVNLNAQIKTETDPAGAPVLARLFGNDLVDIAADRQCQNFLVVSRGGNYVLRAHLVGDKLNIDAPSNVVRFQTGNIPTGVTVHRNGKVAYANNEVNLSVSVLSLEGNNVLDRDVPSGTPPQPGSTRDAILKGRLAFFTALGIPDNGLSPLGIRDIVPLQFRGKQSADAWSSCASCHPFGLADRVTWLFGDGPRNTIAMDGLYSKLNGAHDIRINNWSAARDSPTDFNNNSRNVQCGKGFAGGDPPLLVAGPNLPCPNAGAAPPNPAVFDHGISSGASEALDVQTAWIQTIRTLNIPKSDDASAVDAGAVVFGTNCASCHGGAKWTKSQVFYLNNPALSKAQAAGGLVRDPGLVVTANQIVSYSDAKVDTGTLTFLDNIGTFSLANPIEIRGQGGAIGQAPLGAAGFNTPTLLGVAYSAPYFHNGSAQTLEEVFVQHLLGGASIHDTLSDADEANLLLFLQGLDGRTPIFDSNGLVFKDPFRNLP